MSHQEQATLEYANACKEMLEDARVRIDKTISEIDATVKGSTSIMDRTLESMLDDLHETASRISRSIDQRESSIGTGAFRTKIDETREFLREVNAVTLKSDALTSALGSALASRLDGTSQDRELDRYVGSVADEKVARMMRLLARNKNHKGLSMPELQTLAESKLDPSKRVSPRLMRDAASAIQDRMEREKLSSDVIEKVVTAEQETSPLEMMNAATDEIIDERLRRSAVQAIVGCISKRGFIVERKNIRLIKETDTVRIIAMKPGGQRAEFSIDLHGRFIYHFQGYEGRACEKDITPMEADLERVYGIKLTERRTIWENPDRLNQSHHREMKARGGC